MGLIVYGTRRFQCPLAFGDNSQRRCTWCGKPLTGRQRRWCSETHSHAFATQHSWTFARARALQRDSYMCRKCGATPAMNPTVRLEVHHRNAIKGRHAQPGCWHHLDNLMTLCVACHKAETAKQRAAS